MHQHEGPGVGQPVLDVDADEAEFGRGVEVGEGVLVLLREQGPEFAEAAEMINGAEEQPEARDEQNQSLGQVGHDDRGLAAHTDIQSDCHGGYRCPRHDFPAQQRMQGLAQRDEIDADVPHDVEQDDEGGRHARLLVEAGLEVFRNRYDSLVIDDGYPHQHQDGHPEPVVEVGLRAGNAVFETDRAVLDEAVAPHDRGDARKGDEPPGEPLSAEEEVLRAGGITPEEQAESQHGSEIGEHDDVVEVPTDGLSDHNDPPLAQ